MTANIGNKSGNGQADTCWKCGREMALIKNEPYHCRESGLDNVFLYGIAQSRCKDCGEEIVTIPNIKGLHLEGRIFLIRGRKVMLSMDLAELYEVEPRILMQAVKRNAERFPPDFMIQLTLQEFANLKSQFVISSWGGRRALPYAFPSRGLLCCPVS